MKKLPLSIALLALPLSAFSVTLVEQLPNDPEGIFSDALASNGAYFYEQSIADNFTLGSAATVQSVQFWGSSEGITFDDNTNFPSFEINILDASLSTVYSATVSTASLAPTATGTLNGDDGIEYLYTLDTGNLGLGAGDYILNVGAVLIDGVGDAWVWSVGATGDGTIFADFFDGNGFEQSPPDVGDVAIRISGQPVPEPASMAALGLGVAALARRRRRK